MLIIIVISNIDINKCDIPRSTQRATRTSDKGSVT